MNDADKVEEQLRAALNRSELPGAPSTLRARHASFQEQAVPAGRRRSRGWSLLLVPIAAILVLGLSGLFGGGPAPTTAPTSTVAIEATSSLPTSVDGLAVMTVSQVLAARANGTLGGSQVAVGGFWSDGSIGHSCVPAQTGELEIYCHDGEWGITELDEPDIVINSHGRVTEPTGPHLTPWFPNDLPGVAKLFSLPFINGQRYPPIPIVVVGHFDDARAADCRPQARQLCLDRLVVDKIAVFDIGSVPTPAVSPTPTPFPSPAPSGLFAPTVCAGDVPYSFMGWTTTADLGLPFSREGHVWAVVTANPVLLGGPSWNEDPAGSTHKWRWWGRMICIGEEGEEGSIEYGHVPGSSYQEWDDGRHVPGEP